MLNLYLEICENALYLTWNNTKMACLYSYSTLIHGLLNKWSEKNIKSLSIQSFDENLCWMGLEPVTFLSTQLVTVVLFGYCQCQSYADILRSRLDAQVCSRLTEFEG